MLASKLYSPTLREIPADAEIASHQYMLKAGLIRKNGAGYTHPASRPKSYAQDRSHHPRRNGWYRRSGNHDAYRPAG